jgi:hypothetical protein
VITGFNTDVEHDGVIYHVQTEDKGLATPLILSLVYTGGEILASKRSPYEDLIRDGFDEATLAERIQRQHRLICAAIHAGRVEDLKRMGQRALEGRRGGPAPEVEEIPIPTAFQTEQEAVIDVLDLPLEEPAAADQISIGTGASASLLHVNLLEERELRGGQFVTLRVRVSRGPLEGQESVPDAHVVLKTLGTTFRPVSTFAKTDKDGVAIMFAALPKFTTGRGAILVRADVAGEKAELRRIILPA